MSRRNSITVIGGLIGAILGAVLAWAISPRENSQKRNVRFNATPGDLVKIVFALGPAASMITHLFSPGETAEDSRPDLRAS